jgi:hypothetical protein
MRLIRAKGLRLRPWSSIRIRLWFEMGHVRSSPVFSPARKICTRRRQKSALDDKKSSSRLISSTENGYGFGSRWGTSVLRLSSRQPEKSALDDDTNLHSTTTQTCTRRRQKSALDDDTNLHSTTTQTCTRRRQKSALDDDKKSSSRLISSTENVSCHAGFNKK